MHLRTLGRTGLRISEIGFGAWGIGGTMWIGSNDVESMRALHRAIDLGINFIDTALVYGNGHSERLVGASIRDSRAAVHVATKIPPKNMEWPASETADPDDAFPAQHVVASTETSLRNLGLDAIDLQQFHVWSDAWVGRGSWQTAVEKLKKQGKIRRFGVSLNDHQPENALKLIETGLVDSVQVIYNVFEQSPEDRLFPACQKHGVGVIARVPLDEGGLTGKITPSTKFPPSDFRNEYFTADRKRDVSERIERIAADLGVPRDRMPEVALRYILSHPAVSTVIPGMRTVAHVESNIRCGDGEGLPPPQQQLLKKHRWVRNFYPA